MAGAAGLEPANSGVKVRCLTAWLRPCIWSWWRVSNPRPRDPKSRALPSALHQDNFSDDTMKAAGWSGRCLHNASTPFCNSVGRCCLVYSTSSPRCGPIPLRRFHHGTFQPCAGASVASVSFTLTQARQHIITLRRVCTTLGKRPPAPRRRSTPYMDAAYRIMERADGVEPSSMA